MSALVRAAPRPVILLGSDDICFACPTEFALDLGEGARVSFFPMRAVAGLDTSTIADIVNTLTEETDAPRARIEADVTNTIQSLRKAGLIGRVRR